MSTQTKRTAKVSTTAKLANQAGSSTSDQPAVQVKKQTPGAKQKTTRPAKGLRALKPDSHTGVKGQELVCRYCGSDDLAPSFKKRRDARCRTCFKQRYSAASRHGKGAHTRKPQVAAM